MQYAISLLTIFLISFYSLCSKAAITSEQEVLIITSDFTKKTYSLILKLDEKYHIIGVKTKNNLSGKVKSYPSSYLNKEIVLAKAIGIKLITLKCVNFNPADGCKILITYPFNLTLNDFDTFKSYMSLNNKKWGFYKRGKKFKTLKLYSKKFLGLLIGISKMTYN